MAPAANVTLKGRALGLSLALSVKRLWKEKEGERFGGRPNNIRATRGTRAEGIKGIHIPFRS